MTYKKKLIEVAIPLDAINAASTREKSIRHGHPSTLHLWWARRPLAACRAVLFAQLVDDPSSHPEAFPTDEAIKAERKRLFKIIEDLVKWENSTNEGVLKRAHAEIRRSCGDKLPLIYDPFSGGGSIPLEAQRLGLPAYGSDLNPVAVMIGKAMIEIPPKFKNMEPVHPGVKERNHYRNAEGLAEDVKYYGEWMRKKAWERIGHLYPKVDLPKEYGGGNRTVIAWLWTRTVPSPDPAFSDVDVPIASSFLLSSKPLGKEAWVQPIVDKSNKTITYRVRHGGTKDELEKAKRGASAGPRQGFRCIISDAAIPYDYIRKAAQSGRMGAKLIAIVAEGKKGRIFMPPTEHHEKIAFSAQPDWRPELLLQGKARFDVVKYGMEVFADLFTDRQLVALNCFSDLLNEMQEAVKNDHHAALPQFADMAPLAEGGSGRIAYAEAIRTYLAFAISKMLNFGSSLTSWNSARGGEIRGIFARQAIPMIWDYAEANFFSKSAGSWSTPIDTISKTVAGFCNHAEGRAFQKNAALPIDMEGFVVSSDPPYYDNILYADISDFFYVWLRRNLKDIFPDLFSTISVPKADELVAHRVRHGSAANAEKFFLDGMTSAIKSFRAQSRDDIPATIYYAFKQSEIAQEGISSTGWAAFLQAMINSGYAIYGTWPVRTERPGRANAIGSNALANSVVLVCRKKDPTARSITRAEFIRALKHELPPAIADLQAANIAPTDMPQSAIGPGMGIFSRSKSVIEADDTRMTVKTALQLINIQLDEYLNDLYGDFDADTRFTATWFEQHGYSEGIFGTANNIATARGISVENVKDAGIIESSGGKVRILPRDELDPDWSPEVDRHVTIWECCQHTIRVLEEDGERAAAKLLAKIGSGRADLVKDLAYYLYDVCGNKRQDAKEATSYNGLIAVWSDLTQLAASTDMNDQAQQTDLDL